MRLLAYGTAVFLAAFATAAHADTYSLFTIAGSSGSIDNVGFTNGGSGAVVVYADGCAANQDPCYLTFTPPDSAVYSTTKPATDLGNGSGDYVLNATKSSSVNSPLIVLDQATNTFTTVLSGNWGSAMIDSFGDVLFTRYLDPNNFSADSNIFAVNETAHAAAAVTPEPTSFALLGTGFLGLVSAMRRRSTHT